jgi:hypothetical protein
VHHAVNRFPQLVGEYFDRRTVNYHNTLSRVLGVRDTYLRYEFGGEKGSLHSHAVSASTIISVVANRARDRAEAAEMEEHKHEVSRRRPRGGSRSAAAQDEGSDADDEEHAAARATETGINREANFRRHLAREVHRSLTTDCDNGAGETADDPGYVCWEWQSRHMSCEPDGQGGWTTRRERWRQREGEQRAPRGRDHPASKTLASVLCSREALHEQRARLDN